MPEILRKLKILKILKMCEFSKKTRLEILGDKLKIETQDLFKMGIFRVKINRLKN